MKIAIDAMLLSAPAFGIRTYISNLLKWIPLLDKDNKYLVFSGSSEFDSQKNFIVKRPFKSNISAQQRILWQNFVLPRLLFRENIDVFHMPDHLLPLLPIKAKKIITVHDLCFYKYPQTFGFMKRYYKIFLTPLSIKQADFIIADSFSTKSDIIEIFSCNPEKIGVVHLGVSNEFKVLKDFDRLEDAQKKYNLPSNFILFVGTLEKRKNIESLIDAYRILKEKKYEVTLVIVGKKGWLYQGIFDKVKKYNLENHVVFISGVDQNELVALYNLAKVFVYPSLYEGFGLPVLEAMACGCPVIASNVSSIPEIASNASILIDPKNIEELCSAIEKVLIDDELRNGLIKKGLERVKNFTWEKCVKETLAIYNSIRY